jgi:polyisoprenoid-binding protein YceI
MKKYISILIMALVFTIGSAFAQTYKTSTGQIKFVSETDFEKFEAINNQVSAAITSQGKLQFKVPVNSFEFEKKLMQTHFQENYMESATFPNGTFKGDFKEFQNVNLKKAGSHDVVAKGTLEIHGVSKEVEIPGKLISDGKGGVVLKANFDISCKDYGVNIPKNVVNKVSDIIKVSVNCSVSEVLNQKK